MNAQWGHFYWLTTKNFGYLVDAALGRSQDKRQASAVGLISRVFIDISRRFERSIGGSGSKRDSEKELPGIPPADAVALGNFLS
jgi:hypothetical protein